MTNPFSSDPIGDLFGLRTPAAKAQPAAEKPAKPLPAIRGKRIDGVLYVRAGDVADALASQAPEANKRLIAKLRAGA